MTASGEPTLTSDDDDDPRSSRNEVWDTLAEIFFPAGVTTRATEKRLGRVVATLTRAGATRGDILARRDRWPDLWPGKQTPTLTLEALEKWWDTLAVVDPPGGDDCDRCSNRRQLARLFDGTVAPFGSDQAEAVGVDYPIRCPDCLPAQAAEQLRAMP